MSTFSNGNAPPVNEDVLEALQKRLGPLHAKLRLGIEADHEAQVFGQGINYFHIENFRLSHFVIRTCLKLTGLYRRGCRNAARIEVRLNCVTSPQIPKAFDGYTILQLSDLHVDVSRDAMARLTSILNEITYDAAYGVLGNHDTVCMVPGLERMGIRMLLNECETIERNHERIHLVGVDDAHFYRADNIE